MKYPHIKKTVSDKKDLPIMVGDKVKFKEDVESRSLPWDGKVTMVGYPDENTVKITIDTKIRTIICTYTAFDPHAIQYRALNAESYDKESGFMTLLPDFGIIGVDTKHGFLSVKPIRYKFSSGSPFPSMVRKQFTIGYEGVSTGNKLVPMQIGDTFKSRAGSAGKEYQVDWIASDGAVVVHRIDGFKAAEIDQRKRNGTYDPDAKRPFESLMFRKADRTFWAGVDDFEYAELVTE